jgi:hypothetical protein
MFAQVFPRENSVLVAVVPTKGDSVFSDRNDLLGTRRSFIHGQSRWLLWLWLTGLSPLLLAFFIAKCTGTSIPQPLECIVGAMAVLPVDLHAAAVGKVYANRLRSERLGRELHFLLRYFGIGTLAEFDALMAHSSIFARVLPC